VDKLALPLHFAHIFLQLLDGELKRVDLRLVAVLLVDGLVGDRVYKGFVVLHLVGQTGGGLLCLPTSLRRPLLPLSQLLHLKLLTVERLF
jgi:hypothetical protein